MIIVVQYFLFNGDADGICALIQMTSSKFSGGVFISGVKRDIQLMKNISVHDGDSILALDISLARNEEQVDLALSKGAQITWIDHHLIGERF